MPIRIASLSKKIAAKGQALHRAMQRRMEGTASKEPSETETGLAEERKQLKEEQAKRRAQSLLPGPTALDKLVRTHRAESKGKKVRKEGGEEEAKKPKARRSRAEKHAEKAAAQEAARKTGKKAAK